MKLDAVDAEVVAELETLIAHANAAEYDEMNPQMSEMEETMGGNTPVPTTRELLAKVRGMLP